MISQQEVADDCFDNDSFQPSRWRSVRLWVIEHIDFHACIYII